MATYEPGEIVYLLESAALGYLEAYQIRSYEKLQDGKIYYTLAVYNAPPQAATFGDRFSSTRLRDLKVIESDLVEKCVAIDLCIASLTKQLTNMQSLKDALCPAD